MGGLGCFFFVVRSHSWLQTEMKPSLKSILCPWGRTIAMKRPNGEEKGKKNRIRKATDAIVLTLLNNIKTNARDINAERKRERKRK